MRQALHVSSRRGRRESRTHTHTHKHTVAHVSTDHTCCLPLFPTTCTWMHARTLTRTEVACSSEEFECDRKCVPASWRCDGDRDCVDGTDEANCAYRPGCGPDRFKCHDGFGCIPKRWVCDGKAECRDGSDEMACSQKGESTSRCLSLRRLPRCLASDWGGKRSSGRGTDRVCNQSVSDISASCFFRVASRRRCSFFRCLRPSVLLANQRSSHLNMSEHLRRPFRLHAYHHQVLSLSLIHLFRDSSRVPGDIFVFPLHRNLELISSSAHCTRCGVA